MSYFVSKILDLNAEIIGITLKGISENPSCLVIYFFPALLALSLKKHNLRNIFICNLIFGFTGISWLVVLIWAFVEQAKKTGKPATAIAEICPHCQELVRPLASTCCHCHQSLKKESPAPSDKKQT